MNETGTSLPLPIPEAPEVSAIRNGYTGEDSESEGDALHNCALCKIYLAINRAAARDFMQKVKGRIVR